MDLAHLFRPELEELTSYAPVHPEGIEVRLDANEAPPNPSPKVREVVLDAVANTPLERYPDAQAKALKAAIARVTGCKADELLVGTGSDEVISLVMTAMGRPRPPHPQVRILTPTPTFVMYKISARGHGCLPAEVPLDAAWDLDVGAMKRALDALSPSVVFIASPNNPTGNRMTEGRVREVIEAARGSLVIVDEAYVDFSSGGSVRSWRAEYENLGILRTISKLGLAALRVGWLEADAALVHQIDKVRQPFNVSATSQAAATAVLERAWPDVQAHVKAIVSERERVSHAIGAMGAFVTPSDANFVWVKTEKPAQEVQAGLAKRGVLVRSFHHAAGRMARQIRVTIGTPSENDRLLEELRACVA